MLNEYDRDDLIWILASFPLTIFFRLLWRGWDEGEQVDWRAFWKALRSALPYGVFSATAMGVYLSSTDAHVAIGIVVFVSGLVAMADRQDLKALARNVMNGIGDNLVKIGGNILSRKEDKPDDR